MSETYWHYQFLTIQQYHMFLFDLNFTAYHDNHYIAYAHIFLVPSGIIIW